jgi:catechol 2,3-dioxygenase-like lactoylglutathione lyase family enzyme
MEIDGLHHVALPCADLERSRRFYQEVLGLTEIPRPALPVAGRGSGSVVARNCIWLLGMFRQHSGAVKGWILTTSTLPFG